MCCSSSYSKTSKYKLKVLIISSKKIDHRALRNARFCFLYGTIYLSVNKDYETLNIMFIYKIFDDTVYNNDNKQIIYIYMK